VAPAVFSPSGLVFREPFEPVRAWQERVWGQMLDWKKLDAWLLRFSRIEDDPERPVLPIGGLAGRWWDVGVLDVGQR